MLLAISVIIPTKNRKSLLLKTLYSISLQKEQPKEIIIIDSSDNLEIGIFENINSLKSQIIHQKAIESGAAKQRNQGVSISNFDIIAFFDDDIYLEENCILNLFSHLTSSEKIGGVSALITNQLYQKTGKISTKFYQLISGSKSNTFAGKCIGPVINFLPADEGKITNKVDWLNTTCTMYKKDVLPDPPFPSHLIGYSLMEDLTLSLKVAQTKELYNIRTARIYHDTQESSSKHSISELAKMDLVNRHYIMKNIMKNNSFSDYIKLAAQQMFSLLSTFTDTRKIKNIPLILKGKFQALKELNQ